MWCGNMMNRDKLTGEYYCSSCCVDWNSGISDGLAMLRAYSVQNPAVVNPTILEDSVDVSVEFAAAVVEQIEHERLLIGVPVVGS